MFSKYYHLFHGCFHQILFACPHQADSGSEAVTGAICHRQTLIILLSVFIFTLFGRDQCHRFTVGMCMEFWITSGFGR
jgi:hypothetical protein